MISSLLFFTIVFLFVEQGHKYNNNINFFFCHLSHVTIYIYIHNLDEINLNFDEIFLEKNQINIKTIEF